MLNKYIDEETTWYMPTLQKRSIPLPNIFGNVITYFLEVLIIVVYSICCLSRCNMKSKLQQQFINDDEIYKTKWRALNLKKKWKEIFVKNAKKIIRRTRCKISQRNGVINDTLLYKFNSRVNKVITPCKNILLTSK